MVNIVEIVVEAANKTGEGFKKSEEGAKKHGSHMKSILSVAGAAAGGALAAGLSIAVDKGMELQDVTGRLKVAVDNSGGSWEKFQPILARVTSRMQKLGFDSIDTATSLGTMTTITGSTKTAVKAMADAADFARFKHISLQAATALVSKAMEGSSKAAHELGLNAFPKVLTSAQALSATMHDVHSKIAQEGGITVWAKEHHMKLAAAHILLTKAAAGDKDAIDAFGVKMVKVGSIQKNAGGILDMIHQKIKGQADDYGKTLAGKVDIAKASFSNLAAKVGTALLPALTKLADKTLKVVDALQKSHLLMPLLIGVVAALAAGFIAASIAAMSFWTALTGGVVLAVILLAAVIIKYHKQIWDFIQRIWNDVYKFVKRIWNDVVTFAKQWMILLLGPAGVIVKYHNEIWQFIQRIWNKVIDFFKKAWDKIWNDIKGAWNAISGWFSTFWHNEIHGWEAIWNKVINFFKKTWDKIWGDIKSVWNAISNWFHNFWDSEVRGWKKIWNDVVNFFHTMWDRIWNGAKTAWNNIIGWVKLLPGRILNGLEGLGTMLYNFGHMALTKMWNGLKNVFNDVWNWFKSLPRLLLHAIGIHSPPDWAIQAGKHIMGGLLHGVMSRKHELLTRMANISLGMGGAVGGGVERWRGLVMKALSMEGLSGSLANRVLYQMQTESGGNPRAINLTDINAMMGDPSKGLMQVIGSTFARYHWAGTSWDIYNPLANIAAALNYARNVYGPSLMSGGMGIGSGRGYASGGIAGGLIRVGEHGSELLRVPQGSYVYPHGATGPVGPADGRPTVINIYLDGRKISGAVVDMVKEAVRTQGGGSVEVAFGSY